MPIHNPLRSGIATPAERTTISSSDGPERTSPGLLPHVRERRLRRVLDLMISQSPRSVRDLALAVRLSPTHLQRLFKQQTGVHLSDLLAARRLQRAAHLLLTTDLPIKQIAYAVGYEHQSSFVRAFERRFSQAPSLYRQQAAVALC
jgi:two-component system, response regulator YesN